MAAQPVRVCVKAAVGHPTVLGDCPFSQRVLLTLEEKRIKYEVTLINIKSKSEWFLKESKDGKVPLINLGAESISDSGEIVGALEWISDSDKIVGALEKNFPDPSLSTPKEVSKVGSKIFPTFVAFLASKDPGVNEEAYLLNELNVLEGHLQDKGPYINGEKVSAVDLSLAPQLYALDVALRHYKSWTIPPSLVHVHAYKERLYSRDSFKATQAAEKHVVAGWAAHV